MLRVVITGASSGLGAALARHYARESATLGLIARREPALAAMRAALGDGCTIYPLDVRDAAALQAAAADFIARFGCPDIVIANAGISVGTLTEHAEDLDAFKQTLEINVLGIVQTFQPFIGPMRAAGKGALAGIASVAGYRGLPGGSAYSASKAAAISYLESLRVELRDSGVRVSTICPGYVSTPMTIANPYPMPFLLSAEAAARKIVRAIARGTPYCVIPWQMAIVARVLHVLPRWMYDRLFAHAPRKPRASASEA
jgi:short-subunit dehydrogenase